MADAAGEDEIDRRGEVVAVLQKERPLFGEENLEPLVGRDLRLVGFHLAEVRINRRIAHEAVVQDDFRVETNVGLELAALVERMIRVALINVAEAAEDSVGNDLDVASWRDERETGRGGGLVEASLDAVGDARPKQVLVGARDAAVQNNAPLLLAGVGKPQALKRNRHQYQIAATGQASLGPPHRFKRSIEPAVVGGETGADRALSPQRIPLDPERIGGKGIAAACVVEGVDHDLGRIVGEDIFAARHARTDLLRLLVPAYENSVEVALVIGEINVGVLCRFGAVGGLASNEACHLHHAAGNASTGLHVLEVSERWWRVNARDLNGRRRAEGERRQGEHHDDRERTSPRFSYDVETPVGIVHTTGTVVTATMPLPNTPRADKHHEQVSEAGHRRKSYKVWV